MSLASPADLRNLVLHWWKIIDQPHILKDQLSNFIAFDLYLTSLEKAKIMIHQAIAQNFLVEDTSLEYVALSPELRQDFLQWQEAGKKKARKIQSLLNQTWRPNPSITTDQRYHALLVDLIDVAVLERSKKMRASRINLESPDFQGKVTGYAREKNENGKDEQYPILIDIPSRKIIHNCPEFISQRMPYKQFCVHLGKVIIKLYLEDKEATITLLEDMVHHREKWVFLEK